MKTADKIAFLTKCLELTLKQQDNATTAKISYLLADTVAREAANA